MEVDDQELSVQVSADSAKGLFFSDSEDEVKQASKSTSDVIDITSSPERPKPKPVPSTSKSAKRKAEHAPIPSTSSISPKKAKLESGIKIPLDPAGQPIANWSWKYFGQFMGIGWLTAPQSFTKLRIGDPITFEFSRLKEQPPKTGKKTTKKATENILIRFRTKKGFEAGRLISDDAKWVSKLLDLQVLRLEGAITDVPKSYSSGSEAIITIKVYIHASAFAPIHPTSQVETPKKPELKSEDTTTAKKAKGAPGRPDLEESEAEKRLRARKTSLNKLFSSTGLRPVVTNSTLEAHRKSGAVDTKEAVLDHYDPKTAKAAKTTKDVKGKGKAKEVVEADLDEEGTVTENQVNAIFDRASRNDINLPELDPARGFKLHLRSYQKQALHWMTKMEGSDGSARDGQSMHPLYEEYVFPGDPDEQSFYYSPYSGELTLTYPEASKKCFGGILADEMGLGKTIMMAALIHNNRPTDDSDSSSAEDSSADSEAPYVPSPVKSRVVDKVRQSKLSSKAAAIASSSPTQRSKAKGATLVVCPMSLLHQWQAEIARSCGDGMDIAVYYGQNKGDIEDEIDSGVGVVITSYGTMATEYSRLEGEGGKVKKSALTGLFGVVWHRIILDEAHTIKSRSTNNAKACYALKAKRRWCLTGTPIVNRLEDLYSLLHFIKLEPWSNWSFFRSFVTVPFQNQDPKAIEIIQVILESILLRREKSTKDKDGNPIVPLPPKQIIEEHLDFLPKEREIYQAIYKNARSQFLGFSKNGSVGKNVTAIFAIIMRLRQAVLHPTLVLKNIKSHEAEGSLEQEERAVRKMILEWLATASNESLAEVEAHLIENGAEDLCPLCDETLSVPMQLPCKHYGCKDCLSAAFGASVQSGAQVVCPVCEEPTSEDKMKAYKASKPKPSTSKSAIIEISDSDDADAGSTSKPSFQKSSKQKAANGQLPSNPNLVWSTKLQALFRHLTKLKDEDTHFHAVVFSQFTSFMDIIEQLLIKEGINYVRLDGGLTQSQRQRVLAEFDNPTKPCVMIISLKAGGTGLNLTIANRVYMMDTWWNEAIEDQAMQRVHRFGQTREVTIIRFLINDSIEDRMIALQKRKTAVINAGLKSGPSAEEDFNVIFGLENI